ncbi:MAG: DUF4340 domain-containing protein [Deltaproteobacteria bacterium]|nr:DUF4340 domain-containing protein [Deltaproteobacteria bacterium]
MSWRAVGVVYAFLVLLLAFVLLVERRPEVEAPPPEAAPARSLLGIEPSAVRVVVFRRADARVRAERDDGHWRTVEPARAVVPSDLVDAAVATLTAGQVSEVIADDARASDLATFGLAVPTAAIVLKTRSDGGGREVTVLFGAYNPTRTALYARLADDPRVYLVGLNVRYYEDLIFEAALPGRG